MDFIALSNDSGNWGINTPMYFCMDDFGAQDPNYINYTDIVDFEELTLDPDTHGNSTERTGSFTSSYLTLYSHYDEDYGPEYAYLEGFVYTNETEHLTPVKLACLEKLLNSIQHFLEPSISYIDLTTSSDSIKCE